MTRTGDAVFCKTVSDSTSWSSGWIVDQEVQGLNSGNRYTFRSTKDPKSSTITSGPERSAQNLASRALATMISTPPIVSGKRQMAFEQ
jgi:hypothetical protein